jgi:molybdopterin molybdotransferase
MVKKQAPMLTVHTLTETKNIIAEKFGNLRMSTEIVPLSGLCGRFLAADVISEAFVPEFDRSTVDGFAVKSSDLMGCSESIPVILRKVGESLMGELPKHTLQAGECFYVPTGGALPAGADAMVMIEFVEDFGGGDYGFVKAVAPGANTISKGEDLKPGDTILKRGKLLNAADIGTLAAMGRTEMEVSLPPRVAVLSTGDELTAADQPLTPGKIRDVNSPMLFGAISRLGASGITYPIVPDQKELLRDAIRNALDRADVLLVSGGTSVGARDNLPILIEEMGQVFVHGIAIKPGKPTIIGQIGNKPVIGLPGNPVAAFFIFHLLVKGLLLSMQGGQSEAIANEFILTRAVSSNHGREEVILVKVSDGFAAPVPSKSGLISTVSLADGYMIIPRDTEGLAKGSKVKVFLL